MRRPLTRRNGRGGSHAAPFALIAFVLTLGMGCGEAQLVVQESLPVATPIGTQLPKNLLQTVEYYGSPESDHVVVLMDRFDATERMGPDGAILTMSASGVVRAAAPVDIQSLSVVVRPRVAGATWRENTAVGARTTTYPTQMSAGDEAAWFWTDSVVIGAEPGALAAVDVRTRIVFEVLQ